MTLITLPVKSIERSRVKEGSFPSSGSGRDRNGDPLQRGELRDYRRAEPGVGKRLEERFCHDDLAYFRRREKVARAS